jgi:hypothetical protein
MPIRRYSSDMNVQKAQSTKTGFLLRCRTLSPLVHINNSLAQTCGNCVKLQAKERENPVQDAVWSLNINQNRTKLADPNSTRHS